MKAKPVLLFLFVSFVLLSPCTVIGIATFPFGLLLLGFNMLIGAGATDLILEKERDKELQRKANQAIIDKARREQ